MFNWFQRLLPSKGDFFGMFPLCLKQSGKSVGQLLQIHF